MVGRPLSASVEQNAIAAAHMTQRLLATCRAAVIVRAWGRGGRGPDKDQGNAGRRGCLPPRNTREPIRSLRDWLDHLDRNGRLAIARPQVKLKHELAGIPKRRDGKMATVFHQQGGHTTS